MKTLIVISGIIQAFRPIALRQMRLNESEPLSHPRIDTLDLARARAKAAKRPKPTPTPVTSIYIGGTWFERYSA